MFRLSLLQLHSQLQFGQNLVCFFKILFRLSLSVVLLCSSDVFCVYLILGFSRYIYVYRFRLSRFSLYLLAFIVLSLQFRNQVMEFGIIYYSNKTENINGERKHKLNSTREKKPNSFVFPFGQSRMYCLLTLLAAKKTTKIKRKRTDELEKLL